MPASQIQTSSIAQPSTSAEP